MNRRGFILGLSAALAAPNVVRAGSLMPISATDTYPIGGILTPSMIAREMAGIMARGLRRHNDCVAFRGIPPKQFGTLMSQHFVDMAMGPADLTLSKQAYAERFLLPAANVLIGSIGRDRTITVDAPKLPHPASGIVAAAHTASDVGVRFVAGQDVWNDRSTARFDIMVSEVVGPYSLNPLPIVTG
jgi:hypothetical protein